MTLLELTERCEKATGPERELDGLIEVARDPMREMILYNRPGRFPQEGVRGPIKDLRLTGRDLADYISAPAYTASIDAAMTLIPEGMDWFKERGTYVPNIAVIQGPTCSFVGETDSTFALALCAASLRARNEQVTK